MKKKGGWPKGRKRKPELLENRPPKAPSTGYVLYLNEKRKLFKDMPFPEVSDILIYCFYHVKFCFLNTLNASVL